MEERTTSQRTIELRFDVFGWRALGERARLNGQRVEDVIADACALYADQVESHRRVPSVPRFKPRTGTAQDLTIAATDREWRVVDQESARSGVELAAAVEHAVFIFLEATDPDRRAGRETGPELSPKG